MLLVLRKKNKKINQIKVIKLKRKVKIIKLKILDNNNNSQSIEKKENNKQNQILNNKIIPQTKRTYNSRMFKTNKSSQKIIESSNSRGTNKGPNNKTISQSTDQRVLLEMKLSLKKRIKVKKISKILKANHKDNSIKSKNSNKSM